MAIASSCRNSRMKRGWRLGYVTSRLGPPSGTRSLFSAITKNWRGKPLVGHEVAVNLIGATTTTGLRVKSELDTNQYLAGRIVSDAELSAIHIRRDVFHVTGTTPCYPPWVALEMHLLGVAAPNRQDTEASSRPLRGVRSTSGRFAGRTYPFFD